MLAAQRLMPEFFESEGEGPGARGGRGSGSHTGRTQRRSQAARGSVDGAGGAGGNPAQEAVIPPYPVNPTPTEIENMDPLKLKRYMLHKA